MRFVVLWALAGVALFSLVWVAVVWLPDYLDDRNQPSSQQTLVVTTSTPDTSAPAVVTTTTAPAPNPPGTIAASTTTTSSTTTTTVPAVRPPVDITVKVRNSTSRSGIAAALASNIAALGYVTLESDNYGTPLAETYLYYEPGYQAEAFALSPTIPNAIVAENPAGTPSANLLIILGADYPG
ncbi:MAG: LytR C-terminal domain-containing protein [Acidimicrobiia bacterium]|nr:LytR C-terminal domain-containing protein [Acidimicrobiia bacterium]